MTLQEHYAQTNGSDSDDEDVNNNEDANDGSTMIPQAQHAEEAPVGTNIIGEYVVNNQQGFDDLDFVDGMPQDYEYLEYTGMHEKPLVTIPTTDTTLEPIFADIDPRNGSTNTMTNHALLNCYGSCLVRRNKKLSGTLAQRNFLQKQATINNGDSIPLAFPEGMLFTNVFPTMSADNSIIGALPASLLHGDEILNQNGFCSLLHTLRTRLMNHALLSSADAKYHFWVFDVLANFSLRGCDSRVILRKGFVEKQGSGGICFRGSKEPIFNSEHIENRAVVSKLCASIAEKTPTYFYTHSASMRTHFGLRLIWAWLMSDEIESLYCEEVTDAEKSHWRKALLESMGPYLLRAWMELCEIWLLYITRSPNKPAGDIDGYFCRVEFQSMEKKHGDGTRSDSKTVTTEMYRGNLPHTHSLFYTTDRLDTPNGLLNAADCIRGFVDDIIRPEEEDLYLKNGVFKCKDDLISF
jgi:hypothetical protein